MLTYNDETHEYFVDGVKKINTTSVFSNVGTKNSKGYWNSISGTEHICDEYSAEFGKEIHKCAVYKINGTSFKVNSEVKPYIVAIDKALLFIDGLAKKYHNLVVDWKTSVVRFDYWRMQLAAYARLCRNEINNLIELRDRGLNIVEKPLYSGEYDFCGTPDYVIVNNVLAKFATVSIRLLPNEFKPDIRKPSEVETDFYQFLNLLNTYRIGCKV